MIELNKQAKKKNKWFDLIGEIGDYVEDLTPVGSRYICNTTDTDNDLLCYIPGNLWEEFEDSYSTYGWKRMEIMKEELNNLLGGNPVLQPPADLYGVAWEFLGRLDAAAPQQKVNKIKVPKPWYHGNKPFGL